MRFSKLKIQPWHGCSAVVNDIHLIIRLTGGKYPTDKKECLRVYALMQRGNGLSLSQVLQQALDIPAQCQTPFLTGLADTEVEKLVRQGFFTPFTVIHVDTLCAQLDINAEICGQCELERLQPLEFRRACRRAAGHGQSVNQQQRRDNIQAIFKRGTPSTIEELAGELRQRGFKASTGTIRGDLRARGLHLPPRRRRLPAPHRR